MVLRVLALVGVLCLYGAPAFANGGGGQCTSVNDLAPWLRIQGIMRAPTLIPRGILEGEQAERIVGLFNAEPPVSNVVADTVVYLARHDAPYLILFLARGECIVDAGQIRIDLWDTWQGDPS